MSVCPTCGHCSEDELVHSTPATEPVRSRPVRTDEWHDDLAALVGLVRRTVMAAQRQERRELRVVA